jgi:hypothetical protein
MYNFEKNVNNVMKKFGDKVILKSAFTSPPYSLENIIDILLEINMTIK